MKYFLALSAVILAASALPTDIAKAGNPTHLSDDRVQSGMIGFATVNVSTTGGAGGSIWTVWDPWALRDAVAGDEPRIIYIRGRLDLTQLFTGSPGVEFDVGSYKSIIGGDRDAMVYGGGFRLVHASQVIFRNLKIHNAISYAPGEKPDGNGGIIGLTLEDFSEIDGINITDSSSIWVDHCDFDDYPWTGHGMPEGHRRHDGQIDITRASTLISISNSIFKNHDHVMLIGHVDNNEEQDVGKLKVSVYLNWFQGVGQRNPRVRYGEVHVLNNLYTDIGLYALGAGAGARIYAERNVFVDTKRAWEFPFGIPDPLGHVADVENILINSSYDESIPTDVTWLPSDYYQYTPMPVDDVEAYVRTNAGVL